jgi:hypothetical protein
MKLSNIPGYEPKELRHSPFSEFSDRLAKRICAEAMDTPSVTQVANRVGIPVNTLYHWLRAGHDGDPRYQQFALDFAKARGTHENRWLANVEDVAQLDDPRAANAKLRANEFLLKSHFRREYGDTGNISAMIDNRTANFNLKVLSSGQMRTLHTMLKAVAADHEGNHEDVQRLLAEMPTIDVEEED